MSTTAPTVPTPDKKSGLLYWAQRTVEECDNADQAFAADPVHDLRVAIRRCRSMADGFLSIDSDRRWKQMKRMAKPLFASLGELRDVQVMMGWIEKLSSPDDPVRAILLQELHRREEELKAGAQQELARFDRKQWLSLNACLGERAETIALDGAVFQVLALERWQEAHRLHGNALRNRSAVGYHQLRIGIKRLRYTVENFLPSLHKKWSKDLRVLQDALGEVHDFDVLWAMVRSHPEIASDVRAQWRATLQEQRNQRLSLYRERMVGRRSLWTRWRAALPSGGDLEAASMEKLRLWASFLNPDSSPATRVTSLALQLYDCLAGFGMIRAHGQQRRILEAAAMLHDVGRSKHHNGHRRRALRLLRKLSPPPSWTLQDMRAIAIVARYHCGTIAPASHRMFAGIPARSRNQLLKLAGMLRLAYALVRMLQSVDSQPLISNQDGALVLSAPSLNGYIGPEGERLASAKYLLEATCHVQLRLESVPPAQN